MLSNIFKYALEGSRVYINIVDLGTGVTLTIKNISAYELNISFDELMERFKRNQSRINSKILKKQKRLHPPLTAGWETN